ncbi:MAG: hypothetical protein COB20_08285 [SAR86 cluster bacterium]|uniref:Uncharacterized protein n=1 Tax=SAR86 cluster bacterium TaxID=2030880 RepID=A0A2A4X3X4_9GAMM|nr:MAG: hypothetical protein COB20_08285 [SAR86 cluster bacterium]
MPRHQLTISVRDYTASLFALAVVFVAIHLGLYFYNYQVEELPWLLLQLFDLDEENNLPTWYASFILLNIAFFVFIASKKTGLQKKAHWQFIAFGFLLLAIDEVAGLHESFNSSIEINWAIPGAILVLFLAAAYVPFLLSLRGKLALLFILSGALFVSGAIVTELLSEDMDSDSWGYTLAVALEEGLEMFGALLFLQLNLREMAEDGSVEIDTQVI